MNKELYIELLEEHVDDLKTAAKIDTVLTERKIIRLRNLETQLLSLVSRIRTQDELVSKIADTAMDYQDDLEDLQADWADDRIDCIEESDKIQINYVGQVDELRCDFMKTLETLKERNTRANDEIVLLRSKGTEIDKELKREVFQLNKQNDDLHKQLNDAVREIAKLHGDKSAKEENK